jgi:hypothetical protein
MKKIKTYQTTHFWRCESIKKFAPYIILLREEKRKERKAGEKISPPPLKKSHLSGEKGSYPLKIMFIGEKIYIKE